MENVIKNHKKPFGFNNNQLKIIAMIAMVFDHVGLVFFPSLDIFRIIGRLAFPIFAYMIAEGCKYTKNRTKYLLQIGVLALICQVVYLVFMQSFYQSILVTFTLAILVIFSIDNLIKNKNFLSGLIAFLVIASVVFLSYVLPEIITFKDYAIDYSYLGVLLPILIYYAPKKWLKLLIMAIILCLLSLKVSSFAPWQWYSLLTLPLLFLYDGTRGKLKLKYMFYIFYPLHLALIYGVDMLIFYLKWYL